MKKITTKYKNFVQKFPKKIKIIVLAAILAITGAGLYGLYAFAQSVIDSFTDTSKVADTWNVTVDTASGEAKLSEKSCDAYTWYCSLATTCANTLGDGTYIVVAQADAPTTKQWKTENTNCDMPQCGIAGGNNGDNLKADNTIDFTSYPARDYCKSIGGRLPTKDELNCIYTNRASFGSFASSNYWSSTEVSTTYAWFQGFSTGNQNNNYKASSYYVRCVRGW